LFTGLICFILSACFSEGAFQFPVADEDLLINEPVIVNIYIQATPDMGKLIGSYYDYALAILVDTSETIWGTGRIQRIYRSDVSWIEEQRFFVEYGYDRAFSYPLDPSFWVTSGRISQSPQIFDYDFYHLNWYYQVGQESRSVDIYREVIHGTGWSELDRHTIFRTIEEISILRDRSNEVSIFVTNFSTLYHAEEYMVSNTILNYLNNGDSYASRAITTFSFYNRSEAEEFHFLLLGNEQKVAALADRLGQRLRSNAVIKDNFVQGLMFYSNGIKPQISSNISNIIIDDTRGTRRVFERDLVQETRNYFTDRFGNDTLNWPVFNVWPRLLESQYAVVSILIPLEASTEINRYSSEGSAENEMEDKQMNFISKINVAKVVDDKYLHIHEPGRTHVVFDFIENGYLVATLNLDLAVFNYDSRGVRLSLSVYMYDEQEVDDTATIGNELFTSTFTRLATNVSIDTGHQGQVVLLMTHISDLDLYFIKN